MQFNILAVSIQKIFELIKFIIPHNNYIFYIC
jgi:hypothetical protein